MLLLIDNYDSFTYNLYHFLGELGAQVEVRRNDKITAAEALALRPQGIVISPGPCDPDRAGICLALIAAAAGRVPIFGVCLGHRSEEHTSELQSLMRISYAVFCLKKKKNTTHRTHI